MSIDQHINVTTRVNNSGIARIGFGTVAIVTYKALFPERSRAYSQLADVIAAGFASDSPEAVGVARALGQSPRSKQIKLIRGTRPPTQRFKIEVADVTVGKKYGFNVGGEGVTETEVSYTPAADFTFVDADVNVGADTIAKADHGEVTGNGPYRLSNAGGALPTGVGIAVDTNVWVIAPDGDTLKLAASKADALAGIAIDITAAAGGGVHTLRRAQNDVIIAQLEQGLNAVPGKNFTAAQQVGAGETDHLLVTADAAGNWFWLEVLEGQLDNLTIEQNHVDSGIADDLNEILLVDKDWYYLDTSFNSKAMVLAAAAVIEATPFKAYIVDVVDSACEDDAAGGGDVLDSLNALDYKRTLPFFRRKMGQKFAAGMSGRLCPLPVGSWTAAYKTIVGTTPDDFTANQTNNLDAKRASYYKSEAGVSITWEGKVPSEEYAFFDVTVALDFVIDDIQKSAFGVKVAMNKVSYTDEDIAVYRRAIEGAITRAMSDRHKIVARGTPGSAEDPPPSVTFPKVADIDPGQRAVRNLPDGAASFRLQGAVHTADVNLSISF